MTLLGKLMATMVGAGAVGAAASFGFYSWAMKNPTFWSSKYVHEDFFSRKFRSTGKSFLKTYCGYLNQPIHQLLLKEPVVEKIKTEDDSSLVYFKADLNDMDQHDLSTIHTSVSDVEFMSNLLNGELNKESYVGYLDSNVLNNNERYVSEELKEQLKNQFPDLHENLFATPTISVSAFTVNDVED